MPLKSVWILQNLRHIFPTHNISRKNTKKSNNTFDYIFANTGELIAPPPKAPKKKKENPKMDLVPKC